MEIILYIAGKSRKAAEFAAALGKRYELIRVYSGKQAIEQPGTPSLIVLDAASMRTTGTRICEQLENAYAQVPVVHIHPAKKAEARSEATLVLNLPLSARRLLQNVDSLLNEEEIIECGPFRMNVVRRTLISHGKEVQLTPKVASLVEIFLRHPEETIDRRTLMSQIWETDYLGDTRTLNVHIRWVRDALENGGKRPKYLKTVRGVGYRLVLPEEN